MEQIPLDVQLDDYAVFETFHAGDNGSLLHALRRLATRDEPAVCWLYGGTGSGRSHLLQACINEADRHGFRAAYLPLAPGSGFVPAILGGMDQLDVVCVDDVDSVAGDDEWEQGLFGLYERVRQRGARLVMAAGNAPLHSAFALPDLVSRFSAGTTFRIRPLSDRDKIAAMRLRAHWRGLDMTDEVAHYLYARVERGNRTLFDMLDRLDRRALAEQRRLTVPFVRAFLAD